MKCKNCQATFSNDPIEYDFYFNPETELCIYCEDALKEKEDKNAR